jgi:hypothetical protein
VQRGLPAAHVRHGQNQKSGHEKSFNGFETAIDTVREGEKPRTAQTNTRHSDQKIRIFRVVKSWYFMAFLTVSKSTDKRD